MLPVLTLATAVWLSGCVSSAGIAPQAQVRAPLGLGANPAPPRQADWWRAWGDPALDDLMARALASNPSLQVAQARLARAAAAQAGAQALAGAQVGGSADASRQHFSATSIYPPPLGGTTRTLANLQAGAAWEFDFFGQHRAAIEAAIGAQRAAQAEAQAAQTVLASSVARAYVQLARGLAQREVLQRMLKQRSEVLALIQQRVKGGLDTAVEQRQGEGALPELRQQIEAMDEQITLSRHGLAALSAQAPQALDSLRPNLQAVPLLAVPADVPADLMGRRADITAARWRIEAATSDMQSARAQFYPNVNLSAFVGLSSIGLNHLLQSGSEQYGAGPAVHLPLFDAGRLRAQLRGKAADVDAAVESYNAAVLDAIHEAADQLGSVRSIERQQLEQAQAQAAAESAYDLATQRFKAGLSGYLTVLNAETAVLNQRRLAVDLKARQLDTQIALVRALGGGYAGDAELAARMASAASAPGHNP